MLRILHDTKIDFIRLWKITTVVTLLFILPGLAWIAVSGYKYSIEFTGGTLMQVRFAQAPNVADVRSTLDRPGIKGAEITQFGTDLDYLIRAQDPRAVAQQIARRRVDRDRDSGRADEALRRVGVHGAAHRGRRPAKSAASSSRRRSRDAHLLPRDAHLPRVALRVALRRRRRHRDGARHPRDARVHQVHAPRDLARRRRRHPDGDRLFAERHDHHLRSRARESAQARRRTRCTTCSIARSTRRCRARC